MRNQINRTIWQRDDEVQVWVQPSIHSEDCFDVCFKEYGSDYRLYMYEEMFNKITGCYSEIENYFNDLK